MEESTEMYNVLDELPESTFNRFKVSLTLSQSIWKDFSPIPWGRLEKADSTETVRLMMDRYDPQQSLELAKHILRTLGHGGLVERVDHTSQGLSMTGTSGQVLSRSTTTGVTQIVDPLTPGRVETGLSVPTTNAVETTAQDAEVIRKLKKRMEKNLEHILLGFELNAEGKDLCDMYTKLHVLKGYKLGAIHDTEALRRQDTNVQASNKEETIELCNVFTSEKRLLTLGVAGVGKTISVRNFILDWAKGYHNQQFDFVFPLSFRVLNIKARNNKERNDKCSLIKLLESQFPEIKELKAPLHCYEVLFIFDGLDECALPLHFDDDKESDVRKDTTLDTIVVSIISGSLLPSASVWVTSRPAAASRIRCWSSMQMTEIRGFNEKQKIQYFERNCEENIAKQIKKCLNKSITLSVMCQIPLFCWILLIVTKEIFGTFVPNQNNNGDEGTMTVIYLRFLRRQMHELQERFEQNRKGETEMRSKVKNLKPDVHIQNLLNLGKLAFYKLQEGLPIFYEQDLKKYGISNTNAEFLTVCTQTKDSPDSVTNVYEFLHLSIQEFLAAFFAFYSLRNDKNDVLKKRGIIQWLYWLVFSNKMLALQKTAVDQALESTNGHLDLFLRFLLGFTLMTNQKLLQDIVPDLRCKEENIQAIADYIQQKIQTSPPEKTINLFYCLKEMKTDSLVTEIQSFLTLGKLSKDLSPTQWSALVFVLLTSDDTKNNFDLKKYGKSEALEKLLPVMRNTHKALLDNCRLDKNSCKVLAEVISSPLLIELDLSNNDLQDAGVRSLCLEPQPNATEPLQWYLHTLRMSSCHITKDSCSTLATAICRHATQLTTLDLSYNNIQDLGVIGLKPGIYQLHTLLLRKCELTVESCNFLGSILTNSNLKVLDMSKNSLKCDSFPSVGLNFFFTHLEELRLQNCKLTAKSCGLLASHLKASTFPTLKALDMSHNNLNCDDSDDEMDIFFETLRSHCNLQKLRLQNCNLKGLCDDEKTPSRSLPKMSSQLKMLDLSTNDLQDEGISFICSELERLSQCNLTGKSCAKLVAFLEKKSLSVTELDLSRNDLQLEGAEELSKALKDPTCRIKKLRLTGCLIPQAGFLTLTSALQNNENLDELDLTLNFPEVDCGKDIQPNHRKLRNVKILQYPVLALEPSLQKELEELSREDMEKFKDSLLDYKPDMLETQLRNASAGDTLRLMTQCYGAESALKISQDILKRLSVNEMEEEDEIMEDPVGGNSSAREDYAESVFFYTKKEELCDRLQGLENILKALEQLGVLTVNEKMRVESESKGKKQNRALIDILSKKQEWAHRKFYQSLQKLNPGLLDSLEVQIDNNRLEDDYQMRYKVSTRNVFDF